MGFTRAPPQDGHTPQSAGTPQPPAAGVGGCGGGRDCGSLERLHEEPSWNLIVVVVVVIVGIVDIVALVVAALWCIVVGIGVVFVVGVVVSVVVGQGKKKEKEDARLERG